MKQPEVGYMVFRTLILTPRRVLYLTKVHDDTTLVNSPLSCPKCKSVTRINFVN